MGIRKLNKFLTSKNLIKSYYNINSYVNKYKTYNNKIVIAIDFWLYANKFSHSCDGIIIVGFWNQIIKLLSHRIIPIYIIDGAVPIEKKQIIETRNKTKQKNINKINKINDIITEYIDISELSNNILNNKIIKKLELKKQKIKKNITKIKKSQLKLVFELFNIFNILYLQANFEADALCAKLFDHNIIIGCLSDDMDMLALGCKSTIKFSEGKILEYNLEYILNNLNITFIQFIDICILFGCDYLKHPLRLDCEEIYDLILKYKSFEGILENANHNILKIDNYKCRGLFERYYTVKDIYLNSKNKEDIPNINIVIHPLNIENIIEFLEKNNFYKKYNLQKNNIIHSLKYINNHIKTGLI